MRDRHQHHSAMRTTMKTIDADKLNHVENTALALMAARFPDHGSHTVILRRYALGESRSGWSASTRDSDDQPFFSSSAFRDGRQAYQDTPEEARLELCRVILARCSEFSSELKSALDALDDVMPLEISVTTQVV